MTRVVISPSAEQDLTDITNHYLTEAGVEVATAFLMQWDRLAAHLANHPESGSPRLADKVAMPNLRVWPVKGFHIWRSMWSSRSRLVSKEFCTPPATFQ